MKKTAFLLLLAGALAAGCQQSTGSAAPPVKAPQDSTVFPKPTGWVSDFDSLLTGEERTHLEREIGDYEKRSGNQIGIVTLRNFRGTADSFDRYSTALFNRWGVGQKDRDNGVMIAVCKSLRKVRITTGTGVEQRLTNAEATRIINDCFVPNFRNARFADGLQCGTAAVMAELDGR